MTESGGDVNDENREMTFEGRQGALSCAIKRANKQPAKKRERKRLSTNAFILMMSPKEAVIYHAER